VTSIYPEAVAGRIRSPRCTGVCDGSNAHGTGSALSCGSVVRISARIAEPENVIEEVRFTTNGCGYMIAAADVLAGLFTGRRLAELRGLDTAPAAAEIVASLGALPAARAECVSACFDALRSLFAGHRSRKIAEFAGDDPLVCTCFGVSESVVEGRIREMRLTSVDEVGDATGAGTGCGSCLMLIQEMLDSR
jgi:NifU-like protein